MASKPMLRNASKPSSSYEELRTQLQLLLPSMSVGQQRLAHLILSDPEGCAFRTAADMAELAAVHESSVVRFASWLGLDGYPALSRLCRDHLRERAQLVRRFEEARRHHTPDDLLMIAMTSDEQNLTRTYSAIDPKAWDRAVALLTKAPAVHVIGLWKCFSIAYLFVHLLRLVRGNVHQLHSTSGLLVDQLHELKSGDVLVAISIHRYAKDTVRALRVAHEHGVQTVVLTDNPASPLAAYGDVVFYLETGGVTILRSLTAFTSVVQALATAVAVGLGTHSRAQLLRDEELYGLFEVFVDETESVELPTRTRSAASDKPRSRRRRSTSEKTQEKT